MSLPSRIVRHPRRNGWWTYWHEPRRGRVWKKLANSRPLAETVLERLVSDMVGPVRPKYDPMTLRQYYDQYKRDFLTETRNHSWSRTQRHHIEKFILPTFGAKSLSQIDLYSAEAWYKRLDKTVSRKYARHIAQTFKRMLSRAEGRYVQSSPIRALRVLAPERKIPATLSREQVRQAYASLRGTWRAVFVLLLNTGLRMGEIQHLQWGDVDMARRKLYIRSKAGHRVKDCEERAIDLTQAAMQALHDMTPGPASQYVIGGDCPISSFGNVATKWLSRGAGFRVTVTLLRHTFASMFLSSGGNLAELKAYMGHSSIVTTETYYAAFLPAKNATIHNVDFGMDMVQTV